MLERTIAAVTTILTCFNIRLSHKKSIFMWSPAANEPVPLPDLEGLYVVQHGGAEGGAAEGVDEVIGRIIKLTDPAGNYTVVWPDGSTATGQATALMTRLHQRSLATLRKDLDMDTEPTTCTPAKIKRNRTDTVEVDEVRAWYSALCGRQTGTMRMLAIGPEGRLCRNECGRCGPNDPGGDHSKAKTAEERGATRYLGVYLSFNGWKVQNEHVKGNATAFFVRMAEASPSTRLFGEAARSVHNAKLLYAQQAVPSDPTRSLAVLESLAKGTLTTLGLSYTRGLGRTALYVCSAEATALGLGIADPEQLGAIQDLKSVLAGLESADALLAAATWTALRRHCTMDGTVLDHNGAGHHHHNSVIARLQQLRLTLGMTLHAGGGQSRLQATAATGDMEEEQDPAYIDYPPGPNEEWLVRGELEERMEADATIATAPRTLAFLPAHLAEFPTFPAGGERGVFHDEVADFAEYLPRSDRRELRLIDRLTRSNITSKLNLRRVVIDAGRAGSRDIFAALALARDTGSKRVAIVDTRTGECRDLSTAEMRLAQGIPKGLREDWGAALQQRVEAPQPGRQNPNFITTVDMSEIRWLAHSSHGKEVEISKIPPRPDGNKDPPMLATKARKELLTASFVELKRVFDNRVWPYFRMHPSAVDDAIWPDTNPEATYVIAGDASRSDTKSWPAPKQVREFFNAWYRKTTRKISDEDLKKMKEWKQTEEDFVFTSLQAEREQRRKHGHGNPTLIWWYTAKGRNVRWRLTRVEEGHDGLLHLKCLTYREFGNPLSERAELTPETCNGSLADTLTTSRNVAPEYENGFIFEEKQKGIYYRSKADFLAKVLWLPAYPRESKIEDVRLGNLTPPFHKWADIADLYVTARTKSDATEKALGELAWARWITASLGLDPVKLRKAFKTLRQNFGQPTRNREVDSPHARSVNCLKIN